MNIPENKKVNLSEALDEKIIESVEEKKSFSLPAWADFGINTLVIIFILTIIRTFIFLPFNVDGPSMEPTLHNKEFIYVDKLMPSLFGYDYGDVVVFYPPTQNGKIKTADETGFICGLDIVKNIVFFQGKEDPCNVQASFVKRIIALPGDRVEVKNGGVWVTKNGETESVKVTEEFLMDSNKRKTSVPASIRKFQLMSESGKDFGVVPEGKYFVLGDNRMNSSDSRAQSWDIPFVTEGDITGIVRAVYLSPQPTASQESQWGAYWEAIKNVPSSFSEVRWIGDEGVLGE